MAAAQEIARGFRFSQISRFFPAKKTDTGTRGAGSW